MEKETKNYSFKIEQDGHQVFSIICNLPSLGINFVNDLMALINKQTKKNGKKGNNLE